MAAITIGYDEAKAAGKYFLFSKNACKGCHWLRESERRWRLWGDANRSR